MPKTRSGVNGAAAGPTTQAAIKDLLGGLRPVVLFPRMLAAHRGDGGAAEEMDRDGADDGGGEPLPKPGGYAQMTKTQQRNWRVKQAKKSKWLQTKP